MTDANFQAAENSALVADGAFAKVDVVTLIEIDRLHAQGFRAAAAAIFPMSAGQLDLRSNSGLADSARDRTIAEVAFRDGIVATVGLGVAGASLCIASCGERHRREHQC